MAIRVIVGEPMSRKLGFRETAWEIPETGSETAVSLRALAHTLGIALSDSEGILLVFVNGELVPFPLKQDVFIQDGDRLEFLTPMAGG